MASFTVSVLAEEDGLEVLAMTTEVLAGKIRDDALEGVATRTDLSVSR